VKPTNGLELPGGDVDGVEVAGRDVVRLEPVAVRWLLAHPLARRTLTSIVTATPKPDR
jgi:hypothetical protein